MSDFPVNMQQKPVVEPFFDPGSNTISYIVIDTETNACAVIDSVLDFDYAAGRTFYDNADKQIEYIRQNNLSLEWIIETHVHADHLSAAPYLQESLGGKQASVKKLSAYRMSLEKYSTRAHRFNVTAHSLMRCL